MQSTEFYTQHLGFKLERPMPNGQRQEPGGWNRVVLKVSDLTACIAAFKKARAVRAGAIAKFVI